MSLGCVEEAKYKRKAALGLCDFVVKQGIAKAQVLVGFVIRY